MTADQFACPKRIDGHLASGGDICILSPTRHGYWCYFCGELITSQLDRIGRYRWAAPPVFTEDPAWDDQ